MLKSKNYNFDETFFKSFFDETVSIFDETFNLKVSLMKLKNEFKINEFLHVKEMSISVQRQETPPTQTKLKKETQGDFDIDTKNAFMELYKKVDETAEVLANAPQQASAEFEPVSQSF
jgi:hypothetical protein